MGREEKRVREVEGGAYIASVCAQDKGHGLAAIFWCLLRECELRLTVI